MKPRPEDIQVIQRACQDNLKFLCKEILGMKDWGAVHDELQTFLDTSGKRKLVMLPRGHLKSSIVTKGWSIQQVLRNPNVRILLANAVWDNARKFLRSIESYLTTGTVLPQYFGNFSSSHWNQEECTVAQRTAVHDAPTWATTGLEKEQTGQHYDIIILDDLVAKENTATPEMREKVKEYYGLLYALLEPNGVLVAIGTRYHQNDLYDQIIEDPEFDKFIKAAYTDPQQTQVLYPEKFTREKLEEIRKGPKMGPYLFAAQFLNNPVDPSTADFRHDWIKYYEPGPKSPPPSNLYITVDPAISLSRDADYTAMVVAGMYADRTIRVVDYVHDRFVPSTLVERLFQLVKKWGVHRVGIETFAFQKTLKYEVQRQMRERGVFFTIDELGRRNGGRGENQENKEERIRRLQPFFEQGLVEIRKDMTALYNELLHFPRGKHDDIIDALSYQLDYLIPSMEKRTLHQVIPGSFRDVLQKTWSAQGTSLYEKYMEDLRQRDKAPYVP